MYLGSDGACGGILFMWDKRFVEKVDAVVSYFSVSCRFWNVVDQHECAFSGVYGCHIDRVCQLMWKELGGIAMFGK